MQFTQIGVQKSRAMSIRLGVPQMSGPLLFVFCMTDIYVNTMQTRTLLYADDTVLYIKEDLKTDSDAHHKPVDRSAVWL